MKMITMMLQVIFSEKRNICMCPNDKSFGKFFPSESDNLQEYCMRERERRDRERDRERKRRER